MSTYLQLCQKTAQESGTVPNIGDPTSVSGQTDERLQRVISWVDRAWREIQMLRYNWGWLYSEFSGNTVNNQQRYTAANMGISTRFGRWHIPKRTGRDLYTVYKTSEGQSTEVFLNVMKSWDEFYRTYLVGSAATETGKPQFMAIDPNRKLVFHPTPDGDYTIRGAYYKSAQTLSANTDTPEMPEEYHDMIMYKALLALTIFDEAPAQYPGWITEYDKFLNSLMDEQLPDWDKAEPMA